EMDVIGGVEEWMLRWNQEVTGRVGRMIEVYNPNPYMTFGGMGSKKLIGPNIEYVENNDSHPGAQFNLEFRGLVKSEINRVTSESTLLAARIPDPSKANSPLGATALAFANERSGSSSVASSAANRPAKAAREEPGLIDRNRSAAGCNREAIGAPARAGATEGGGGQAASAGSPAAPEYDCSSR